MRVLLPAVAMLAMLMTARLAFGGATSEPSSAALDVLNAFDREQLSPQTRRIVRSEFSDTVTNTLGSRLFTKGTAEVRQDVDGRLDWIERRWRLPSENAPPPPEDKVGTYRELWTGKALYEYGEYGTHRASATLHITSKSAMPAEFHGLHYRGEQLDGTYPGDFVPFTVAIKDAPDLRLDPQPAFIDGERCVVVLAKSKSGSYRICLDPAHGYVVLSAKVVRQGDDEMYGKKMSSLKASPLAAQIPGFPTSRETEFVFSIDQVSVKQIEQHWVPISAIYSEDSTFADGTTVPGTTHIQRTFETFSPGFAAAHAFVPEFPNGTRVFKSDSGPMEFEWRDGKVHSAVEDQTDDNDGQPINAAPKSAPPATTAPGK